MLLICKLTQNSHTRIKSGQLALSWWPNRETMQWTEASDKLSARFVFKDFKQAFAFMTECAMHIEKMNHHPSWSNTWNQVDISLQTHDAGNVVTEKDHRLAERISEVYLRYKID